MPHPPVMQPADIVLDESYLPSSERTFGNIVRDSLAPSIIRTLVPIILAFVTTALTRAQIDTTTLPLAEVVGAAVSLAVYAVIRFFEEKGYLKIGMLLGWAKKPTYDAAARFDPNSPTGIVATAEYIGEHRRTA